jgi:hypothetical protein
MDGLLVPNPLGFGKSRKYLDQFALWVLMIGSSPQLKAGNVPAFFCDNHTESVALRVVLSEPP